MADTLKQANRELIAYGNTCCSCDEIMVHGGWWGQHEEGYRVGPFCNHCTDKASVKHQVDDPSMAVM